MSQEEETIRKLHEKLELARRDKRVFLEKVLSPILEIRFVPPNESTRVKHTIMKEESVRFNVYNPAKIILTIGVPVVIIPLLSYYSYKRVLFHPIEFGILIGVFVYLPLMFYYWRSPEFNKKLVIAKRGIFFEGYWYEWNKILTIHIKEIDVLVDGDNDVVTTYKKLTLGLVNLSLIDLDVFKYKVTEQELCNYIVYYSNEFKGQ